MGNFRCPIYISAKQEHSTVLVPLFAAGKFIFWDIPKSVEALNWSLKIIIDLLQYLGILICSSKTRKAVKMTDLARKNEHPVQELLLVAAFSCSTQIAILSKTETHIKPICISAKNYNVFAGKRR